MFNLTLKQTFFLNLQQAKTLKNAVRTNKNDQYENYSYYLIRKGDRKRETESLLQNQLYRSKINEKTGKNKG